jgi:hypothetical protein
MARWMSNVEAIQAYFQRVVTDCAHHGSSVDLIIYPLMGLIMANASGEFKVETQKGETKHTLWIMIRGAKYAVTQNFPGRWATGTRRIEIREGGVSGPVVGSFSNTTPLAEVVAAFASYGLPPVDSATEATGSPA